MPVGTNQSDVKGKRSVRYVCSTDPKECRGLMGYNNLFKVHSTQEQTRQCQIQNLLSKGYEQIGPREFADPETGRILVLNKTYERSKPGKADRPMMAKSRMR